MKNRQDWPDYISEYWKIVNAYAERAGGPEAGRLAKYAAAIDLTAALAHAAMSLPWTYRDPLGDGLWEVISGDAIDASGESRALHDAIAWSHSHQEWFIGRERIDSSGAPTPLASGWAGYWPRNIQKDGDEIWDFIGFYKHFLESILRDMGYEPEAILSGWREKGWIQTDGDRKRYEKNMKVRGAQTRLVVIQRRALEEAEA